MSSTILRVTDGGTRLSLGEDTKLVAGYVAQAQAIADGLGDVVDQAAVQADRAEAAAVIVEGAVDTITNLEASLSRAQTDSFGPAVLVSGSPLGLEAVLFDAPSARDQEVASFRIMAARTGTFRVWRDKVSGGNFTSIAVYTFEATVVGLNEFILGPGELPFLAGEYLRVESANLLVNSSGSPADPAFWDASNQNSGTLGTYFDLPNVRMEVHFTLRAYERVVTGDAFLALEGRVDVLDGGGAGSDLLRAEEYAHHIIYGQSLSLGHGATVIDTVAQPHALKSQAGVRAQDGGADPAANWATLAPLLESWNGHDGETVATGHAVMLRQLYLSETGVDLAAVSRRQLYSAPGRDDSEIVQISKGTESFTRLATDIQRAKIATIAASRSYAPQSFLWLQGESDESGQTPPATYKAAFRQLVSDAQDEARTATGDASLILPAITYQASTFRASGRTYPAIALAQLEMSADDNILAAAATYFLPYSDAFHLTGVGSRWLGAYMGLAFYRWVVEGAKPEPLAMASVKVSGNTLLVRYNLAAGRKLAFDTTTVPIQDNYGFSVVNDSGVEQTIGVPRLVDPAEGILAIQCPSAPVAGWKVRYAHKGNTSRGLGNLRDDQGDSLIFEPAGINKPLHNWAFIDEAVLS
ncbi:sialate O-acetylesterase [Aurantiacibacter luteus]|uniref:Sialate O-acetylesterase domain-containing protein n=1 Tax=Aurantiacibacter luteus TaxID=1581420 RepID=A0A0G9MT06_9SPHN|nr:sialate O-acetylesterase [Aurantiacibacter luteus]KLE32463.1 hypothetical protein AAW00_13650 [Aurantiacibacter luteus]